MHCANNFLRLLASERKDSSLYPCISFAYEAIPCWNSYKIWLATKTTSFVRSILNFVNKIFVISKLITKFMKILCHETLELYSIYLDRQRAVPDQNNKLEAFSYGFFHPLPPHILSHTHTYTHSFSTVLLRIISCHTQSDRVAPS